MARVAMTLLAQERWSCLEHLGDRCAVGIVANGAVFGHRLMVVYERPALFRMALVTGLVDAVFYELPGTG